MKKEIYSQTDTWFQNENWFAKPPNTIRYPLKFLIFNQTTGEQTFGSLIVTYDYLNDNKEYRMKSSLVSEDDPKILLKKIKNKMFLESLKNSIAEIVLNPSTKKSVGFRYGCCGSITGEHVIIFASNSKILCTQLMKHKSMIKGKLYMLDLLGTDHPDWFI